MFRAQRHQADEIPRSDMRMRADDFSDRFDLTQTPISFQVVPAKVDGKFFLTVKRPVTSSDG